MLGWDCIWRCRIWHWLVSTKEVVQWRLERRFWLCWSNRYMDINCLPVLCSFLSNAASVFGSFWSSSKRSLASFFDGSMHLCCRDIHISFVIFVLLPFQSQAIFSWFVFCNLLKGDSSVDCEAVWIPLHLLTQTSVPVFGEVDHGTLLLHCQLNAPFV